MIIAMFSSIFQIWSEGQIGFPSPVSGVLLFHITKYTLVKRDLLTLVTQSCMLSGMGIQQWCQDREIWSWTTSWWRGLWPAIVRRRVYFTGKAGRVGDGILRSSIDMKDAKEHWLLDWNGSAGEGRRGTCHVEEGHPRPEAQSYSPCLLVPHNFYGKTPMFLDVSPNQLRHPAFSSLYQKFSSFFPVIQSLFFFAPPLGFLVWYYSLIL